MDRRAVVQRIQFGGNGEHLDELAPFQGAAGW
jgi:hypothetical protein